MLCQVGEKGQGMGEEVGWELFRLDTLLMCPRTEKVESILIIFKNCKYDFNIKI